MLDKRSSNSREEEDAMTKAKLSAIRASKKVTRAVDQDTLKILVEQILGEQNGPEARRVKQYFTSDVVEYLDALNVLASQLVGIGLQDPGPRTKFAQLCNDVIAKGERAITGLDKATAKRVKEGFRTVLAPWVTQNPFLERCLKKPRGYAGDFLMMEVGYLRWTAMEGGLAGAFDRYFADCYDNVRQRKIKLVDTIRRYLVNRTSLGTPLQMISLGSGPCREWVDLDHERRTGAFHDVAVNKTRLVCIDKDPEALAYGLQRLKGNSLLESVEIVEADLFNFTQAERWRGAERTYDFIYGVGIANYFYDATLQNIIAGAISLVKPGGELMITHKDGESFNFPVADWFCDWVFLKRSEHEFAAVFQEALSGCEGRFNFRVERIPDGTMFFGLVQRIV